MLNRETCPTACDDLVSRVHAGTADWQLAITAYDVKMANGESVTQTFTSLEVHITAKLPEVYLT